MEPLKISWLPNKSKENYNIVLDIKNTRCYDNKTIVNHINAFFTDIAQNLVTKLPKGSGKYNVKAMYDYYNRKGVKQNSFGLKPVSEEFVFKELKNLNGSKGTGLDNMPAKFIKDSAESIKGPITYIINLSIKSEQVPNEMKKARVTPLIKKTNRFEVGNYRPVSILSTVSKILEKSINTQLTEYLVSNDLLYQLQSGFWGAHSTDTCLIYLQDHIRNQLAAGNLTGMVLLDIQKAFDCVDHELLCTILQAMGVNNTSVNWFKSLENKLS